ncbi:Anaphase-promoting complex subunit [Sesamum angolense]|uniref:Anaphase-promoting complex subunit 5 n=1 Tax=Sesamum angolense TaxID=2727404 RepID=A0AAE1WQG7_9LAMI|nr:Anaphase-promoting complex subunit [Sesamum angolense]
MRVQDMNFDIVILIDIDTGISPRPRLEHNDMNAEVCPGALSSSDMSKDIGALGGTFLHTSWQVQGYLSEQAFAIEKHGSSFPLNAFESILKKLQQLAPELHRVHYLRYLNSLYHDDYPGALENLHRYFDYSAGTEGVECVSPPSGCSSFGRYEIALLCLGMMHFHLGHPKQALEDLSLVYNITNFSRHMLRIFGDEVEGDDGMALRDLRGRGGRVVVIALRDRCEEGGGTPWMGDEGGGAGWSLFIPARLGNDKWRLKGWGRDLRLKGEWGRREWRLKGLWG